MGFVKTHQPCDSCGSSDALSINDDGSTKCFSCGEMKGMTYKPTSMAKQEESLLVGDYKAIIERRIEKDVAQKYNALLKDGAVHFGYHNDDGLVAVKSRTNDRRFISKGNWKAGKLFGQQLFNGGGKYVTITEGEFDAMSLHQILGKNAPVVSIRNGAQSAAKDCREQYDWIDSFDNVVICFDNDDPGRAAAKDVADMFGSKARIVNLSELKDANEYLVEGKAQVLKDLWWTAERYTPDGIVTADRLIDQVKKPVKRSPIAYPFKKLDDMLYGIRPAELVTLCAGSGLGKSTILRETVVAMLSQSSENLGLMFLEETPERTLRGLIGLEMNKPIHLPDVDYDPEEVQTIYESRDYANRVFFWDSFGSNEIERVLGRMRYMVKALGCRFIILDHLSILVSDQSNGDERKAIDMCMTKLRMFAQEMRITLLLVSHLKRPEGKSLEDGAATSLGMLRGSGAIAQLSDAVIGAERNSQAEDPVTRNTTRLRVLKNRFSGKTGPAGELYYDETTGRVTEVDIEEAL